MLKLKIENLNIKSILTSGACFRYILESDGSITNILKDRVVNIKQENDNIYVKSNNYNNLKEIIYEYFDLNTNYEKINNELISNNDELKDIINKCKEYRILNQDSFEMCISYIISQNNNVKRISKSINEISKKYGKKVIFENKEYYLFPTYDQLKNLTTEEIRQFGVGFRDKYIRNFLNLYPNMKDLNILSTKESLEELMKVKGIGLKVASCILLFGYKRLDVFPIDTWVKQYISSNYNIKNTQKDIEEFARNNFGKYSGLVIQYMFHSQRNVD